MLTVKCCRNRCVDRNGLPLNLYRFQFRNTHSIDWDCRGSETGGSQSSSSTDTHIDHNYCRSKTTDDGESFYRHFQRLPYEMRLECLSYCGFHVMASPELWLPLNLHVDDVMRNHHVAESSSCYCTLPQVLDFVKTPIVLQIALPKSKDVIPFEACATNPDREVLDKRFGAVNRYPSFYYRSCVHYGDLQDVGTSDSVDAEYTANEISERWRLLHRFIGTTKPLDQNITSILNSTRPINWSYLDVSSPYKSRDRAVPECVPRIETVLDPGLYYWELVNYNWEQILAAIQDTRSRQQHFYIDPSDTSHTSATEDRCKRFYFSLMLRRVCHPGAEPKARFTNIGYFDVKHRSDETYFVYFYISGDLSETPDGDQCSDSTEDIKVYPETGDRSFHPPSGDFVNQMVYSQLATPTFDIKVHKILDERNNRKVKCYRVSCPPHVTLYSIDRNNHTVRLNCYVDATAMARVDVAVIGSALMRAVRSNIECTYNFTAPMGNVGIFQGMGNWPYVETLDQIICHFYDILSV